MNHLISYIYSDFKIKWLSRTVRTVITVDFGKQLINIKKKRCIVFTVKSLTTNFIQISDCQHIQ